MTTASTDTLIRVRNVTKTFPGVRALQHVDFDLHSGEVHALLGENGAGKSTLIKILSGIYEPNQGEVWIQGQLVRTFKPQAAKAMGVVTVFQELSLVPHLTVEQNIWLGREPVAAAGWLDQQKMRQQTEKMLAIFSSDLSPEMRVQELSSAKRQIVEIIKALSLDVQVIIMDEPTDKLPAKETDELFAIIKDLKQQGKGIIYITHKLEEVPQIADRVTVLRDGEHVATQQVSETSRGDMIRMMVGRELAELFPRSRLTPGDVLLRVEHLSVAGLLHDVSFEVRAGEIVGMAGLIGAGRTDLALTLIGMHKVTSGQIFWQGQPVHINSPRHARQLGLVLLPEDRRHTGLIQILPVRENIVLASLDNFVLNFKELNSLAYRYINRLNIRTAGISIPVSQLSGGNQQKVVLAKWLCRQAKLFIFDEPTVGIDVGSKVEIYQLMNELTAGGAGIIMISSDMLEILGMSDRIIVMGQGAITGQFDDTEVSQEVLLERALTG